jgi:uncharacterized protein YggU (UPF0235/DUF167 family)
VFVLQLAGKRSKARSTAAHFQTMALGKANAVVIELLAEHYGVPKKNIQIVSGHTTRLKWIEVITIA